MNTVNTTINTQIKAVTVYTNNQALIIRQGEIELTGTERKLIIEGLPYSIQTDSVRTRGSGNVPVKILGLQTEEVFSATPIEEKVKQLNQQSEELKAQKTQIENQLAGIKLQRDVVQNIGKQYLERFSSLQHPPIFSLEEIGGLLDFIGSKDLDYASQITQYENAKLDLDKQLKVLQQRLRQIQRPDYRNLHSSYTITIAIESENQGRFNLEISYLVNNASWQPLYDLRSNEIGDELNLTYLAKVQQKTGEDWVDIALTLSTAKPAHGKLPSKLKPLYIQGIDQYSGHRRAKSAARNSIITEGSSDLGEIQELLEDSIPAPSAAAIQEEEVEAEQVTAEASQIGGIVTFSLESNAIIPSDNEQHNVNLYNTIYSCQPQHITVPRLDCVAYLEAEAINPANGVTLLPGKANIFRNNTLIGTTDLEHIAPNQAFKINLGIDEGIKITRTLVNREVELIGNYRRVNYAYRLQITNLKQNQTKIQVIEQLPVARDERIKVRLINTHPPIKLGEMGKLEWSCILLPKSEPESQQEIFYQSSTEYPINLKIQYFSE